MSLNENNNNELILPWKPQIGEIIPAEWFWSVSDSIYYLYVKSQEFDQQIDCIDKNLQNISNELKNIERYVKPAQRVKSDVLEVSTTPTPVAIESIRTKKVIIKPAGLIYVGDRISLSYGKGFVVEKGEKLELDVLNPSTIYVMSVNKVQVYLLFELLE